MILIKGGLIKPMVGSDIENGQVLIDDGKIKAVGKDLLVPDAEVIDASGCIITPGIVEAHCHIGIDEEGVRWEGNDTNEYSAPLTPELRAIDGINPRCEAFRNALEAGVTAVATGPGSANVVGGSFVVMKTCGKDVDSMVIRMPAAMKVAFGENPKGCYGQDGKKRPVTRMAVAAMLRETLIKAFRYADEIEEAKKNGTKAPFDFAMEAMLPVVHGEIPLKVHAHRADDILTAIRIAKEFKVKITLDHVTEGHLIADQLAEAGWPVLVGPSMTSKSKYELRERTFMTPSILDKAGLQVSIITDAPVIPLYYLPLCAGLAVKAGMDENAAWRAITINSAKALGVEDRIGSMEPGKDADVVIFEGNPLREIGAKPAAVFVNGKKVV